MSGSLYEKSGETCRRGDDGRSQSHRSTDGLQEQNKAKRSGNGCLKGGFAPRA